MDRQRERKTFTCAAAVMSGLYMILKIAAGISQENKRIDHENPYIRFQEPLDSGQMDQGPTAYEREVKPAIDKAFSFAALVILSPLFAVISLAIIMDDPGPVIFTQDRVGKGLKFFRMHKFRSMRMSTPRDVPTHQLENPEQYITRVGKFLRKTSLDELPQFWDVFRGKMSVIGPRPALWNQGDLVAERDKYGANAVLPGLTGLAQIRGRDELEIPDKARIDGEYINQLRSNSLAAFTLDVKCLLGTIRSVLKYEGVVEGKRQASASIQ